MDILIKNMEQIDGCYYCPFLTGTTCCACLITGNKVGIDVVRDKYEDERMADCPLVALPEHGRLGDLDQIADRLHGFYEKHYEHGSYETAEMWKYAEQEVRLQGTIVEATE